MATPYLRSPDHYLNFAARHLARLNQDGRHGYGAETGIRRDISEAWRFPLIDTYGGGSADVPDGSEVFRYNEVSFLYKAESETSPGAVGVIGTFHNLYESIPLTRIAFEGEPTRYFAVSVAVPKRQRHLYRFVVDGRFLNDPINPQTVIDEAGAEWSAFFTDEFTEPMVFERWELEILYRIVTRIAPFRTDDATNFMSRFYFSRDKQARNDVFPNIYRLDDSVGEVNFIDNILAREERHHLIDYRICLRLIDGLLRQRNPFMEPTEMPETLYTDLYDQMATDQVPGWDTNQYGSPLYFLQLLRRHAAMGAFSHPRYGGNTGAAGWAYLAESVGPFQWRPAIEAPLGTSPDYLG